MNYPSKIKVGDRSFDVFYESLMKGSSSVRLKNGAVHMRLSRFSMGKGRDLVVKKFLKWAEKKLSKVSTSDFIEPDYRDGGRIVTHNKVYDLRFHLSDRRNNRVIIDGGLIECFVNDDDIEIVRGLVEKKIIKDQMFYLREVVSELNQLYFQEKYNLVKFKRITSRFGSCSSRRNINIAYRLLYAPREVFRYVCVHELSHLKQMNHSRKFWDLVEDAMPEYKKSEKWLTNNGFALG